MPKLLRTINQAAKETGTSPRFINHLLTAGKLTRYKINTATFISMEEFEQIAVPVKKEKIQTV